MAEAQPEVDTSSDSDVIVEYDCSPGVRRRVTWSNTVPDEQTTAAEPDDEWTNNELGG